MFEQELELVHESVEESGSYGSVMEAIDSEWIEQSLISANKASIRNRRLAAQQAVWLRSRQSGCAAGSLASALDGINT
jgi:hypothetical protein